MPADCLLMMQLDYARYSQVFNLYRHDFWSLEISLMARFQKKTWVGNFKFIDNIISSGYSKTWFLIYNNDPFIPSVFYLSVWTDGKWGQWGAWSDCSKTCGGGNQNRTRKCDSPAPANGGNQCPGTNVDTFTCNQQPCPVGKYVLSPLIYIYKLISSVKCSIFFSLRWIHRVSYYLLGSHWKSDKE